MEESMKKYFIGIPVGLLLGVWVGGATFIMVAAHGPLHNRIEFAVTWPYYASGVVCLRHPNVCH